MHEQLGAPNRTGSHYELSPYTNHASFSFVRTYKRYSDDDVASIAQLVYLEHFSKCVRTYVQVRPFEN